MLKLKTPGAGRPISAVRAAPTLDSARPDQSGPQPGCFRATPIRATKETGRTPSNGPHILRLIVLSGAGILALCTIFLILSRITLDFDNEWVESTVVRSIRQIMFGGSMYPAPSVEFLGDGYPPFYFHVCATLAAFCGSPLIVARAVSLVGTLLVALALHQASSKIGETTLGNFFRADRFFPPLLFLSFYAAGGQVFDLARVDMMTIAMASWAAILVMKSDTMRSSILAGLLMACAILSKHNMVLIAAAIGLAVILSDFKRAIAYGFITLTIPIVFFMQLNIRTNGWSNYHLFSQLANNEFGGQARWIRFFGEDISWHGTLLFVLIVAAFGCVWKTSIASERKKLIAPIIIAAGALGMTISGRLKIGGYPNNLVPAWTFALLALAWMMPYIRARLNALPVKDRTTWSWMIQVISLGIVASLAFTYTKLPIRDYIDTNNRQGAIHQLRNLINQHAPDGPIWIPAHCGILPNADTHAHLCPIGFTIDAPDRPARSMFERDMAIHLERATWSAIILDDPRDRFISPACWKLLNMHYMEVPLPIDHPESLAMLSGKKTGPTRLFVRRNP